MMSGRQLLFWQIMVGVIGLGGWYLLSTFPIFGVTLLPPFFFSNPVDVGKQIYVWFATGVIWKHLWVTLIESVLAFVIGSVGGILVGVWFVGQARAAPG